MPNKKIVVPASRVEETFSQIDPNDICVLGDIAYLVIERIRRLTVSECCEYFSKGINHYFLIGQWGNCRDIQTRVINKDGNMVKYIEQRSGTPYIDLIFSRKSDSCVVELHHFSRFIEPIGKKRDQCTIRDD